MLPEYAKCEVKAGLRCENCDLTYASADHLDHVRLADAELLFCPECSTAIAVVMDREPARKSA